TENQDALSTQREALAVQVPDQPGAVGVVAQQPAVHSFFQCIHGPGTSCPLAEGIGEAIGLFLERHGDIGAVPLAKKLTSKTGKIIQRRQQRLVTQLLARLFSKQTVDQRRLAVANGIAEYAVAVHVIPRFCVGDDRRSLTRFIQASASQSRSCRKYSVRRASSLPGSGFQS